MTASSSRLPWTAEEESAICDLFADVKEIAETIGRTTDAIQKRRTDLRGRGLLAPTRPGPKPFFDFAACGTAKQFRRHLRYGVPMCEACRRAENRRNQDRAKKLREPTRDSNIVQVC